jgi:hypothetical protein
MMAGVDEANKKQAVRSKKQVGKCNSASSLQRCHPGLRPGSVSGSYWINRFRLGGRNDKEGVGRNDTPLCHPELVSGSVARPISGIIFRPVFVAGF